jgi:hypothetical protein
MRALQRSPLADELEAIPGLVRFVDEVAALPQVRKLRVSTRQRDVGVWVLVDTEDINLGDQIFRLEREHLSGLAEVDVSVHIVPLDVVAEYNLPRGETIFARP